ncbi:MAG: Diaminopimelate epimerase [Planctomycetota bacterium]
MNTLPFTKMHGLGNDYVYVDGFLHTVADPAALAVAVSDRHRGIGSDGLILVLPPEPGVDAQVRMRMFNADGSESAMCGNGVRCVCKFAVDRGIASANPLRVQTGRGVLSLSWTAGSDGSVESVSVDMGAPILPCARVPAAWPGLAPHEPVVANAVLASALRSTVGAGPWGALDPVATLVSMGNPHLVLWCADVGAVDLAVIGPVLERHPAFPERINVHVVQVIDRGRVRMRTWERGSGITQACGTGACAVAVAGVLEGRTDGVVQASLPGGELRLSWPGGSASVTMLGPATTVFEGTWVHDGAVVGA